VLSDEAAEKLLALGAVEVDHFDPPLAQPVDPAAEGSRLAHHHRANLKLHHQAAAVPARCQGRDHDGVAVVTLAPRLAKGVRLAMHRRIVLLHPPVVPAAQQLARPVKQCGADWNSTLRQALPGLRNRHREQTGVLNFWCHRAY